MTFSLTFIILDQSHYKKLLEERGCTLHFLEIFNFMETQSVFCFYFRVTSIFFINVYTLIRVTIEIVITRYYILFTSFKI